MEWLAVFIAGVLGVLALLFKGRSEGREQERAKQTQEVLDNVKDAKKVADDVAATDAAEHRERLRKYTK